MRGQSCRRIHGRHPAAGDDRNAVRQRGGLLQVVSGEQNGGAVVGQQPDEIPELPPCLGIETGGRFVQEQQLGLGDDAERDVEPAALSAGQRPDLRISTRCEPDEFE